MRFAARWVLPVVVAVMPALAACESDTDIRGEIVLGEPISLDAIPGEPTSLGLLDDWVLVTSSRPVLDADPDLWGDTVVETLITWIDPDGNIGETTSLGWARARSGETPRWLAWEGELWASVRAGDPARPSPEDRDYIRIVSISPTDGIGCSVRPDLPVLESDMFVSVSMFSAGGGHYPATLASDGPVFALSAVPQGCAEPFPTVFRPLLIDGCGTRVRWLPDGGTCRNQLPMSAIQLASNGEQLGVLAASSVFLASDPPSYWQRFARDGSRVGAVTVVGARRPNDFDAVPVPAAVALEQRVLWLDATDEDGFCSFLRTMSWEGGGSGDAPWQPGCATLAGDRLGSQHRRTGTMTDLLPIGDVALFVSVDGPTETDPNPARALVQGVTAEGRRASATAVLDDTFGALAATQDAMGAVALRDEFHWVLRRITWIEQND